MTADQVLELLGPAWSAMTAAERLAYGPAPAAVERPRLTGADFARRYPALALWQRRGRAGVDGLWAVAAWEQAAWEAEQADHLERCERLRRRAREEMAALLARQGRAA